MPYIGFSNTDQQQFAVFNSPDINGTKLKLDADGDTSITADTDDQIDIEVAGSDEIRITAAMIAPATADGSALGGTTNEWSDLYLADGAVIGLGADQDVTLTHVADTGVLLNSSRKIQFGDSASFIHQSADSVLTIDGEVTIDLNASTAVLVSNDLKLNSDAAVLGFGADNDVTVTHVADTAIQVNKDVHAESFNLPITLNGTDGSSTHAGDNIILDASAASTDVGERLLYEGIPETAITALGGDVDGADNTVSRINLKDYGEITTAIGNIGGGTQNLDLELGNNFTATVNSATTTFQFTHPTASDELCGFTLFLKNGGSQTVNWPGGVDWAGGTAPTLTSSGLDILVFITTDGGTIWHGMVASADSK